MSKEIKVFAPASVANVSVGFDIIGFAIEHLGDDIIARRAKTNGVTISKITGDGKKLPLEALKNTAGYAAIKFLESIGESGFPMEMEIHKKMPLKSGLGSSAASAVAGVMAANEIIGAGKSKDELLKFAVMGEELVDGAWHADNVAPSLFGNIVLIRDNKSLDLVHLPVPDDLYVLLIHPHQEIETKESRGVLSDHVSLVNHVQQNGNTAAFIVSLFNNDFALMRRSLQDIIVEPQRKHLIHGFDSIRKIAMDQDAIGFGISGAGPSMFCFCKNKEQAELVQGEIKKYFFELSKECDLFVSKINRRGAFVY